MSRFGNGKGCTRMRWAWCRSHKRDDTCLELAEQPITRVTETTWAVDIAQLPTTSTDPVLHIATIEAESSQPLEYSISIMQRWAYQVRSAFGVPCVTS